MKKKKKIAPSWLGLFRKNFVREKSAGKKNQKRKWVLQKTKKGTHIHTYRGRYQICTISYQYILGMEMIFEGTQMEII